MGNKKYIVIAAVLAMLGGVSLTPASASNSLLQMDVRKSSVTDTVDVTFYTTDGSSSSVVTRKSANRYVVLLPNTDSTASVAPGIGGVKDLITDINVKHVNDGIGGYTKITFGTTKPINIRTIMKKANPVFQAQKDYQNILAQNNTKNNEAAKKTPAPAAKNETKPAVQQSAPAKSAQSTQKASTPKKSDEKPVSNVVKTTDKQVQKPKPQVQNEKPTPKVDSAKPKQKTEPVKQPQKTPQPEVQKNMNPQKAPDINSADNAPKMKFDENGKRIIDLEPRVSHVLDNSGIFGALKNDKQKISDKNVEASDVVQSETSEDTAATDTDKKQPVHFPMWLLIAGGSILTLGVMFFVLSVLLASAKKNKRNESFFKVSSVDKHKIKRGKYDNIVNNIEMNWQEKYKQYTKVQEQSKTIPNNNGVSYITNLSGTKKSIIPAINSKETKQQNTVAKPVLKQVKKSAQTANKVKKDSKPIGIKHLSSTSKKEEFKNQMRAKISQMEHALAQTPTLKEPEDTPKGVRSEDNAIINNISNVKLKSFTKPVSLKEANRSLAKEDKNQINSKNQIYRESKFVALEDSPLNVSRRQSASTELNVSNLIDTGNKYLENNGEMKMNKENENYLLSSLDEYLSILDGEEASRSTATISAKDSLAQVKSSSEAMSRSGISNPISRTSSPISAKTPTPYMNGLIVKSGYNIDSEKGFYLVNIDGVSALVGRIKDSIFILKKFDRVIDKPLQVRHDDGSVYIVRAGGYKCLVDVSKDKMGTLIEI